MDFQKCVGTLGQITVLCLGTLASSQCRHVNYREATVPLGCLNCGVTPATSIFPKLPRGNLPRPQTAGWSPTSWRFPARDDDNPVHIDMSLEGEEITNASCLGRRAPPLVPRGGAGIVNQPGVSGGGGGYW